MTCKVVRVAANWYDPIHLLFTFIIKQGQVVPCIDIDDTSWLKVKHRDEAVVSVAQTTNSKLLLFFLYYFILVIVTAVLLIVMIITMIIVIVTTAII